MNFAANFEVRSDISVISDEQIFQFKHPKKNIRVKIKNIQRPNFSTPFLLSFHIYFEAPSLNEARTVVEEHLADSLSVLALITGGTFKRHRIRQIVDVDASAMRSVLMWGDAIENEDPMPFLNENIEKSVVRMLDHEVAAPIRRAMRWYRLGVSEIVPDEQFMNFWFALEIIAEFNKPIDKVPSKCPICQSKLYCETCKSHPLHRPYPKQAIRSLIEAIDKGFSTEMMNRLDEARNGLMHGSTLKEIEKDLKENEKHIVDILGKLVWNALIRQFPPEMYKEKFDMGEPSTYLHHTVTGVAQMQTVVPTLPNGDLDLDFKGVKMEMKSFGPPQSALPLVMAMTKEQYVRLQKLSFQPDKNQEMLQRIFQRSKTQGEKVFCQILATDMASIKHACESGEAGEWQDLFREILKYQS